MDDVAPRYDDLTGTPEWAVLDRAISELAADKALQETTEHPYIVAYLCKALATGLKPQSVLPQEQTFRDVLEAARAEVRAGVPRGTNLLAEFLHERRMDAANE